MAPTTTPPRADLLSIRRRTHQRKQLNLRAPVARTNTRRTTLTTHRTQQRHCVTPPAGCMMDRYIPSRSTLDVHLVSAEIQESERRYNELIPKIVERKRRLDAGVQDGTEVGSSQANQVRNDPRWEEETAFQRAMGSALHNIPLGDFGDGSRVVQNSNGEVQLLGSISQPPVDLSSLAYASIEEMEKMCSTDSLDGPFGGSVTVGGLRRTLNFGDSSNGRGTTIMPRDVDPYAHNHHKVIQRAVASSINSKNLKPKLGKRNYRTISDVPTRVLDAPDVLDDYYLNLISWSKDNVLAVALGPSVYLWDASTEEITHVLTVPGEQSYISSVSWCTIPGSTKYLAIGTSNKTIQLWDAETVRKVRNLGEHRGRVSSLTWNDSKKWLTSGSRDSIIFQHDVRCSDHVVAKYTGHAREVCGLSWDEEGHSLASGGNDNMLCIWDAAMSSRNSSSRSSQGSSLAISPRFTLRDHKAAVKALGWCPFKRGLLASGGGTADRSIKFWNTVSGKVTRSVNTGSQVCSLVWSNRTRELCSAHGYSENQLIVWDYVTMTRMQELKSHVGRVLNMEMSPNGSTVASIGADDTLRFWDVFRPPPKSRRRYKSLMGDFTYPGPCTVR